jgi:hypothetical protein
MAADREVDRRDAIDRPIGQDLLHAQLRPARRADFLCFSNWLGTIDQELTKREDM